MSFSRSNTIGRGVRPAQVFKKRNLPFETTILSNAAGTLLAEIVLRETGTIYSVKVGMWGHAISQVAGDAQLIVVYVRCVPAGTGLADLSINVEVDTMNGFYLGSFLFLDGLQGGVMNGLNEKFRFRRKCDENSLIQIIARSLNTSGTGRSIEWTGSMAAVIRVK